MGVNINKIFENEEVGLNHYVDVEKYIKYGNSLKLMLFHKTFVEREQKKKRQVIEKEMATYTKKAVLSLKTFEKICVEDINQTEKQKEKDQEYFIFAKEVKIIIFSF